MDECIVPLVRALAKGKIATVASCCGHGENPGYINFQDGRTLLLFPSRGSARAVAALLHRARTDYPGAKES